MKSASMTRKSLSISLLILTVAVLPGCAPLDWIKKQFSSDEKAAMASSHASKDAAACEAMNANVLVTMDGKPVITLDDLEQNYRQVIEERPELTKLESVVKESLFQGLIRQALVDEDVKQRNIQNSDVYKKDLNTMIDTCKKILNVKYFKESHPVTVKDSEVKEYYESNKDVFPDLILERGGVATMAVSFDKESDAKAFLAKAQAAPKDFEKLAREAGHKEKLRDFKFVNARSSEVDPAIKNAILELKTFPHTQVIHACNAYWVVNVTSKKESKYRPFDEQVKEGLRQYMIQEREAKIMDEEIQKLKEKYKVVINTAALNQSAQAQFNFEDAFGMMGDQMAEAGTQGVEADAINKPAQVA